MHCEYGDIKIIIFAGVDLDRRHFLKILQTVWKCGFAVSPAISIGSGAVIGRSEPGNLESKESFPYVLARRP